MISPEELKDVLLQSNNDKKWIYNAAIPKWINRFRQISDKMKVTHGFTSRIYNCPIYMRIWSGRVYANAIDDCWHCQYRIADTEEYILCSGREQIAHIEDFKIPKKIRFKQRSELIAQRQAEPKTIRYCLLCGAVMVERWGRFGPFGDVADTRTVSIQYRKNKERAAHPPGLSRRACGSYNIIG